MQDIYFCGVLYIKKSNSWMLTIYISYFNNRVIKVRVSTAMSLKNKKILLG